MTDASGIKCPPVEATEVAKQPLSHAGADGRAQTRVEKYSTPLAKIQLSQRAVAAADVVFYLHRVDPNKVKSEAICCKVLKDRDPADEESLTRPQLSDTQLTDREHKRRAMPPFQPGQQVRFIPRTVAGHHTLDKVTLWKRPGPHARQINLWWREHRSEQWYREMRRQELHSVQFTGTQATVVSFLTCDETGQRWVCLLLHGGKGLGWTYSIDALELV